MNSDLLTLIIFILYQIINIFIINRLNSDDIEKPIQQLFEDRKKLYLFENNSLQDKYGILQLTMHRNISEQHINYKKKSNLLKKTY